MLRRIWNYLSGGKPGDKRTLMPNMSANEMIAVVHFIRTKFPAEQWTEKTQVLIQYMSEVESQILHHCIIHGSDSIFHLICVRDGDNREGFNMGQFLEKFYKNRGYGCYGKAEEHPTAGHVWGLNFSLSA